MALGTPVAAAAAYSAASGTTVTPAYPTGILTTDVVLLFVGQKPGTANGGTVTTPTGWTLREEITGAGGYGATLGADTGNTNLRIYSWNSPVAGQTGNLSVTLGANNVSWAFILRVPSTRPTGSTITFGSADGQRTTTPTSPLSVALTDGTSATNFKAGDLAIWAMCIPTDVTTPAQFSAQGITATGVTFGTVTEINEPDSGNGNDIGGFSARALVTSGNSSTAPTITATLAGTLTNVRGPVALIRIRETAVLIGDPQTYDETLQPATLTVDRTITASSDTFAFNGNDVTLTKTTPAKILTADVATFIEDLKPANLTVDRKLTSDVATYTEDLKPANLTVDRKLTIDVAAFTVEGTETNFNRGVSLTADSQPYTFIGRDATLFPSRYLSLARTTFTITGPPASLIAIADTHTVTIDPPAGWALHLVTDVSQAGISACIYYNLSPAVAVGDQILYRTTTETNSNAVSVSSTGIVSTVPSGSDTLKFRHWRPSTWSAELTFTVGITARTLTADTQTYTEDLQPANLLVDRSQVSGGSVYRIKTEINGPALFTDTITQPNGTILGDTAEWDRWDTDNATQIISDGTNAAISQQNRDFAGVLVGNISFGPDQWAEQVHSTGSSDRLGAGPIVRGSSGTTANGYVFRPISFGLPSDRFYIHRYINGVNTTIGDSGPQAVPILTTGTYTSRLEIIGNKLYGYINGKLVVTATDSSITSGQPGFQIFYSGGTTSFSAGQIEASTTGLVASRTLSCDSATYTEDLKPANLIVGRKLVAKVYADEQLFSDDFTGTNGVLGAEYTQQGDVNIRRDGLGNANAVGAGRGLAWPNTVTFADSHYAEITITAIETSSNNSGIGLRIQNSASPAVEYGYIFRTGNAGAAYTFAQYNASSVNVNIITTSVIPQIGDRLRAVVVGNNQYFYVNDQLIAVGSSTSWSGGVPAIYGNGTVWKSDNFVAGNYGGLHLAGTYTNTRAARILVCASATYTLELKDATLTKVSAKVLTADSQTYNEDLQPANLKAARTLLATTQTYNEDLQPANLKAARTLLATTQTYNEDLQPANLRIAKRLVADSQIYTFTGRDVSFSSAEVFGTISREYTLSGNNVLFLRSVISSSVAYTFTGRDANLFRGERLTAESRAYNLTGRDATLNHAARVTADTPTFTLTGRDSNLLRGERLTADTSTYTFTGRDANLLRAERVTADVSSFALIGRDANLLRGERVTAESRAYNLTGRDAALNHAARVTADTRSYSLTRNDATLNHAARLTAEFSSYTLATNDANLSVTRKLVADSSSYALTGNTVLFVTTGSLNVTTATFTLTGNSVNFVRSRILVAATQPYNFVPNDAILKTSKKVIADKATYTLTGRAANLAAGEISTSDSQSFILTGNSVRFNRSVKSIVSSYTLTASDTSLKVGRKISLTVSSYITSGIATNLLANKKILAVRVFFDTNGYVDPGYTDPNYVSIDAGIRAARKLAAQVTSFNLNGITVNINRGGFIKVWTGSVWVSKPLKVWDGAAWVSKPLKIWDGTTWRIY